MISLTPRLSFSSQDRRSRGLTLSALMILLVGCSGGPQTVKPVRIDTGQVVEDAMSQLDTDKNGVLAGAELESCASLRDSLDLIDADADGGISAAELARRLGLWGEQKMGLRSLRVRVFWRGQPLEGGDVDFEPETFMGPSTLR